MDNQILGFITKTTITGTIEGQNIVVDFENKSGELPTSVNAFCKMDTMCSIVLNVGAFYVGSETLTVTGAVAGDISTLLAEMRSTVENILITG